MTPHEAFAAGRLAEAVELQEAMVRADPRAVSPRVALIELLLFTGDLADIRTHLAIMDSDDPAWPAARRTFRQVGRAERRRRRGCTPMIVPTEDRPTHALARRRAFRRLREGEPAEALRWIDAADDRRPPVRGFLDGREFHDLRDSDDRFGSVLEAFVDGEYVWYPWEAVSRVKLAPAKFALDRFARFADVRLKLGYEIEAYLPLIYPGSHESDGQFATGMQTDHVCPDGGPVRCIGGKELIVDEEEIALGDVTMIEIR